MNLYLLLDSKPWTTALQFDTRQKTAKRSPKLMKLQNLEMFAVPPIYFYCFYEFLFAFCQKWDTNCMLCVLSALMLACRSSNIGINTQQFGYHLLRG